MMYSDDIDSDIDSDMTPIERSGVPSHGQVVESDGVSSQDFQLHGARLRMKFKDRRVAADVPTPTDSDGEGCDGSPPVKQIYQELQAISERLKEENRILHEREKILRDRERMLSISQSSVDTITDHQVKQKIQHLQRQHQAQVSYLEQQLKEKTKDNKRLKDNFETLKLANDALKKELETLQLHHGKLEKQAVSVQSRLTNLQRKQDYSLMQRDSGDCVPSMAGIKTSKPIKKIEDKTQNPVKPPRLTNNGYEVMSTLLDWICDTHLRFTASDQMSQSTARMVSRENVRDRCFKVLPALVEILRDFPGGNSKLVLPCLQFIYWSLTHIEQAQSQQRTNLSSTLRRLGEELYRSKSVRFTDGDRSTDSVGKGDKSKEGVYLKSSNQHIRLLSSLIILKTLTQVDLLAHVFDILRQDLKSDLVKELFLYYNATTVILLYLKPVNKAFMSSAVDLCLQMSMESPFLQTFLDTCSTECWFRAVALVLRAPNVDVKMVEKLSIILQKLSKIKSNRKFLEMYTIGSVVQEFLRGCSGDHSFLALNLKSILFNLNSKSSISQIELDL